MRQKTFIAITLGLGLALPIALSVRSAALGETVVSPSTPKPTTENSAKRDEVTVKQTLIIAQQSPRPQRIRFPRGAFGTVVEGSVVRGTRAIYLLGARRGQTMTLNMTSLEQNAVFDIQAPNGVYLVEGATNWSGRLPQSGDYSVIVGGTRGNATYTLDVSIR